jgi:uncharacterized ferredoxin-like protein
MSELRIVADLMALAARTAPKAVGKDFVVIRIIEGDTVRTLASILNADNRIMCRAGVVARQMGLIEADFVMGIPLSATGKSIYFDR